MKKKTYAAPQLSIHGNIQTITLQGGATAYDVPIGTPISPNITDIAS